jgi:hypothetical protein
MFAVRLRVVSTKFSVADGHSKFEVRGLCSVEPKMLG